MKDNYFLAIVMIEKIQRLFLEVIKVEIDRMKIKDINKCQCLILYKLGKEQVTIGDLTTNGYFLGTNVFYNLKKMVENGYIIEEIANDKRSKLVKLSHKGIELQEKLEDLFIMHKESLREYSEDIDRLGGILIVLEKFLTKQFMLSFLPNHEFI